MINGRTWYSCSLCPTPHLFQARKTVNSHIAKAHTDQFRVIFAPPAFRLLGEIFIPLAFIADEPGYRRICFRICCLPSEY